MWEEFILRELERERQNAIRSSAARAWLTTDGDRGAGGRRGRREAAAYGAHPRTWAARRVASWVGVLATRIRGWLSRRRYTTATVTCRCADTSRTLGAPCR